ncbi:MAG: TonB-dependent receptor, partial [Sphingomicrobium sp.]
TLNYGARFDAVRSYTREQQLSPRANLVWLPTKATTFHIGYARNFTPPPQELIGAPTLALFNDTAKQSQLQVADPVRAEREHYFDGGVEHRFAGGFKVGVDAYYKLKRNLLDEGQFGSALVLSPFNYAKGYAWGVELSANYTRGPFDIYANVARGEEKGMNINSSQYFFAPDEVGYIADHYIFTDHSQDWTASGGGSVTLKNGAGSLVPSVEFLYGSGLRSDDPAGIVPNGGKLPAYFTANVGLAQTFAGPGALKGVTLRVDVVNLFDKSYLIRDGSGVGVGAPQYGERRGVFAGVTKKF